MYNYNKNCKDNIHVFTCDNVSFWARHFLEYVQTSQNYIGYFIYTITPLLSDNSVTIFSNQFLNISYLPLISIYKFLLSTWILTSAYLKSHIPYHYVVVGDACLFITLVDSFIPVCQPDRQDCWDVSIVCLLYTSRCV